MATVLGTNSFDFLNGTIQNDSIFGFDGADTIFGSAGNDRIEGGNGFDAVDYRNLNTAITLGPAGSITKGTLGQDTLFGVERIVAPVGFQNRVDASTATGAVAIEVNLGARFINIYNIPGTTSLRGFTIENFVNATGTNNNDVFTGSTDNNVLRGLGGNDFFNATTGNDTIDGGLGFDTIDYRPLNRAVTLLPTGVVNKGTAGQDTLDSIDSIIGAVNQANVVDGSSAFGGVSLNVRLVDSLVQVQNIPGIGTRGFFVTNFNTIIGTNNRDVLDGNDANNTFNGGAGNDDLFGRGGNDVLAGGAGNDLVAGDAGDDRLLGSNSTSRGRFEIDTLRGGDGFDRFVLGDRSGAFYKGGGSADFALISDLTTSDTIELGTNEVYRAVRLGATSFELFTVTNGAVDLIARVSGTAAGVLPSGNFSIASGQRLGAFVGA